MLNNFQDYYKNFFKGKNITKQGFGILGRGSGVVKFLIEMEANILITDIKEESFFEKQILEIENYKKEINSKSEIKYFFGGHLEEDFLNCDFVIQGSGIPKDNHFLNLSKKNKIKVYQESSLFIEIVSQYFNDSNQEKRKINFIGITGTRGKTTTTYLIYEILKNYLSKKNLKNKVFLGGNIQNISNLEFLKEISAGDFIVMEMDSWLLQGLKDIKFSPEISVFTNLYIDHMNYYKGDMKEYFYDKANIFLYQKENDKFILSENAFENSQKYLNEEDKKFLDKAILIKKIDIENYQKFFPSSLLGYHNKENISLAIKVSEILNIPKEIIQETILNFKGVKGRLEFLKEWNQVKIYNDTCATSSEATISALNSFLDKKIILFCGGRDKEGEIKDLAEKIIELTKKNILIQTLILNQQTTTGSQRLLNYFKEKKFENYILVKDLEEGVKSFKEIIFTNQTEIKPDIFLFSPSFASFGMFLNEYDRGDKFSKIIQEL